LYSNKSISRFCRSVLPGVQYHSSSYESIPQSFVSDAEFWDTLFKPDQWSQIRLWRVTSASDRSRSHYDIHPTDWV
jgi:hypothetical protein